MKLQRFGKGGKWSQGRIVGFALLGFVLVVAASTVMFSKSTSGANGHAAAVPTLAVQVSAPQATPTKAAPSPTSEPNRADCGQIRGTAYQSNTEQEWFRVNCAGATATTPSGSSSAPVVTTRPVPAPTAAPAPSYNGPTVAAGGSVSGDEMVISRLGIDGYVSASYVDSSGQMGDPSGPYDILWYDFSGFGGLGGAPGAGGNAVFAGHVDYHPHIEAIFWTLRQAQAGDIIDYYKLNGQHLQYQVQWNVDASPDADFTDYVAQNGQDIMTIITCDGVFNADTRHYDHRSVVRAIRIS